MTHRRSTRPSASARPAPSRRSSRHEQGYALVLVLTLMGLMAITLISYTVLTRTEIVSSRNTANSTTGFYAAEAALNARAEQVRAKFIGFEVPVGTAPDTTTPSTPPCVGTNTGGGDFGCTTLNLNGRAVTSYVVKLATQNVQIGAGEPYANLNAEETQFQVFGQALNRNNNPEAITQLVFRSRLVPLFQFAVFFNKDLEYDQTASLDLAGPVHANGNIFLDAGGGATLNISGQVTSSQNIYRGQKTNNVCSGTVNVNDAGNAPRTVTCASTTRQVLSATDVLPWGGTIASGVSPLTVPDVSSLQPVPTGLYWAQADVRVVLKPGTGGTWQPELQDINGNTTVSAASFATICPLAVSSSYTFLDNREATYWNTVNAANATRRLMDVDMDRLTTCIRNNASVLGAPVYGNQPGERGAVYYFTVKDGGFSQGTAPNNYGIRLINGASLHSSAGVARTDHGLSVVSDQAVIVQGHYNNVNKVPAAILTDSINILSTNWNNPSVCGNDAGGTYYWNATLNAKTYNRALAAVGDAKSRTPLICRGATDTTVNAAILAGTDTSGFANTSPATEGLVGGGLGSGGVHNMMRFHEDWGSNTPTMLGAPAVYTYLGSLVSLSRPQHAAGSFQSPSTPGEQVYEPPKRNWGFDADFRSAAKLPPLTPRFVYIKQDNFVRNFQQ